MNIEISTPAWHLFDFNDPQQQAILLQLTESDYRAASFLDQRVEALARQRRELPLDELQDALGVEAGPRVAYSTSAIAGQLCCRVRWPQAPTYCRSGNR